MAQNEGSGLAVTATFGQLGLEQAPPVRAWRVRAGIEERTRVVDADLSAAVDDARAELDRRDVTLPDGSQAHHEPGLPSVPVPLWSGWATIDGLNRAAVSSEHSRVK